MSAPDISPSATAILAPPQNLARTGWQPSWHLVRAVIVMLPILLAVAGSIADFRSTRQLVEARIGATASLLTNYVETALAEATTASSVLADFLARSDLRSRPYAMVETALLADDLVAENLSVAAILVIGRNGEIVADSRTEAAEWPPESVKALLAAHRDAVTAGPTISPPYLAPQSGSRQFNVSVAVRDPGEALAHVVASTIVADRLIAKLRPASPYRDFTITLTDVAGNVLGRHPSLGGDLSPIRPENLGPLDVLAADGGRVAYVGHLQFSPRLRMIHVARVPGFPVRVAYSVAYWEALYPWLIRTLTVGVTALAAAALLYMALGQLAATSRREIEAERAMRDALDRERMAEIVAIRNQDRELIARMAGGVGHQFNNLMGGVLGVGERLARNDIPPEQFGRVGRALMESAERGGTLAHALMIYGGRGFLDARVVELADVVRSAAEAFRTTVDPAIEIAVEAPAAPLHVHVDSEKLATAIGHLLMNAVSALNGPGRIEIVVATDPAMPGDSTETQDVRVATVAVVDRGIGMAPDVLARARDPFFTTRDVGQGAGLGLSMVDGLMQASGGRMEIESRPGAGTRVTLRLPLAEPAGDAEVDTAGRT